MSLTASPKLIKGGLVVLDGATGAVKRAVVLLLLLVGCPSSLAKYDYAREPDPRRNEVVLGVGDVLGINVWENKELNTETTIRPDGPIRSRMAAKHSPVPQPTSRTVSPGRRSR